MKKLFTSFLTLIACLAVQAADYQLNLSYARAYVMDAETHQFQFEFIDMETYNAQGSIMFCAADNHHINGTYTIDGTACTAVMVVGEDQTFEAVSGTIAIEYSHLADYMSYYSIAGTLTDAGGKTLELAGSFGSYSAYDYASYEKYMMGEIGYEELVSYDLLDHENAVVNYTLDTVTSVTGFSMYTYYVKQGYPVACWRLTLLGESGQPVASLVLYSEDEKHLAGVYDCAKSSFSFIDGSNTVDANTGIYTIIFDHKTDSISYYKLKGELQHAQGTINVDCVMPVGLLVDYQSMADNYADPTVEIIYVEPKDYEDANGISNATVTDADGGVYNLAGQRVKEMHKGIFIVNGKKVIKR